MAAPVRCCLRNSSSAACINTPIGIFKPRDGVHRRISKRGNSFFALRPGAGPCFAFRFPPQHRWHPIRIGEPQQFITDTRHPLMQRRDVRPEIPCELIPACPTRPLHDAAPSLRAVHCQSARPSLRSAVSSRSARPSVPQQRSSTPLLPGGPSHQGVSASSAASRKASQFVTAHSRSSA